MLRLTTLAAGLLLSAGAFALSLSDLSQSDASGGLKDALTQGAQIAVKQLGKPGGFSDNDEVRIELPGKLGKAAQTMKMMGMGEQVEALAQHSRNLLLVQRSVADDPLLRACSDSLASHHNRRKFTSSC